MGDGFSIDVGSAVPYVVDSVLGWFGRDSVSIERKTRIERLAKLSAEQSAFVQCVGMAKPVPIETIYQKTELAFPAAELGCRSIDEVLTTDTDLLIFAGPGWGKTTLLHWLYIRLSQQRQDAVPFLFTLRWPKCTDELEDFVTHLVRPASRSGHKARKLILLVDGYDELSEHNRKRVSKALLEFKALGIGNFYLTCRSFYNVYELKAVHCYVEPFRRSDTLNFMSAFSRIYGAKLNPSMLLDELEKHGFSDFAAHPLMLTLVCILKTGANPEIPRRAIGLVRRAIDTLTLRWDEQKGIHRTSDIALDGEERVRCLMRIAFGMRDLQVSSQEVEAYAKDHLRLVQVKGIDVRRLLDELARWYGILVPVDGEKWQFVHRTIHDYLAARFWVESGGFGTAHVTKWTTRAAYATCLLPNATENLCRMLADADDISAFAECLYNGAVFNSAAVANAVVTRAENRKRFSINNESEHYSVSTPEDFFSLASEELLRDLIIHGSRRGRKSGEFVALSALSEVARRCLRITSSELAHSIEAIPEVYKRRPIEVYRDGQPLSFVISDVIVQQ